MTRFSCEVLINKKYDYKGNSDSGGGGSDDKPCQKFNTYNEFL